MRGGLVAAVMPAVLLTCHAAFCQESERQSQAERAEGRAGRTEARAQGQVSEGRTRGQGSPGGGVMLPGPDGRDVLEVTKNAPDQVRAGEQFQYQVVVRNVSQAPVANVVVVEEIDGLQVRGAQDASQQGQQGQQNAQGGQQGQNQQQQQQAQQQQQQAQQQQAQQQQQQQGQVQQEGNRVRYQIGKLDAGQTRTLAVTAVADKPGQAHSCMWVDFQPTICTTIAVVQPDFRLVGRLLFDRGIETQEKVEGVYRCDRLILETEVTSTGDAATPPAQATVQLPQGLTTAEGQNQLQIDLGRLEPGRTVERRTPLRLDPQQAGDQIQLPIVATAGDLKAEVTLPAVKVLEPQLRVTAEAPETAYINRPVEMRVRVENPGQDPVLNTVVRMEGPAGVERFTVEGAQAGRDGSVNVGRLDGGQSREFTVRLEANRPVDATVNVTAEGYCVEAQRQQARVNLQGIPAVLIEVVDKVDPVPVGENTVYEIAVKNQGSERDTNLQLSATLPESMEFVRGDGETRVTAEGKQITFAPLQEIAPGDVVSWTVQVKANRADKARLKVELKSDATNEPIVEQEPTTLFGNSPQETQQQDQQGQQQEQQQQQGQQGGQQ